MKKLMKCVILILLLSGCSPIDTDPAIKAVNVFHALYQSGKYSDIYEMTSSSFQKVTSKEKFINIMNEAKIKHLGEFKNATLKFERSTRSLLSNNEVSLFYYSKFYKRNVQEIFVFEIDSCGVKLKSYRYDSYE